METATITKWFYPLQESARKAMQEKYGTDEITCNYQDIRKDVVHENFKVVTDKKTFYVHVIMNKRGVIDMYERIALYHV